MINSDVFVSVVYVFYVIAPAIRDELWLRLALFINSFGFAAWGLWIGSWPVVVANAMFCVISLRQMHRAWDERRPADLDEATASIGTALFPEMTGRDLEVLWSAGAEFTAASAELTRLGEDVNSLYVVMDGDVHIELADGTRLVRSAPMVVGEVTTLSPHLTRATATVEVTNATVWKWAKTDLDEMLEKRPTMTSAFLQGLSTQMADRIMREPALVS